MNKLLDGARKWMISDDLRKAEEEVNRRNESTLNLLSLIGFPICLLLSFIEGRSGNVRQYAHYCFLAMAVIDFVSFVGIFIRRKRGEHGHAIDQLYYLETMLLFLTLLSGTLADPYNLSFNFMIFYAVLPLIILDQPYRVFLFILIWPVLFAAVDFIAAARSVFLVDMRHLFVSFFFSMGFTGIVLNSRIDAIRSTLLAVYHDQVDRMTGLYNRNFFIHHAEDKVHQEKLAGKVSIAYFNFIGMRSFNHDFGFEAGDELLRFFAKTLKAACPHRNLGRYGEDHFVALLYDSEIEDRFEEMEDKLNTWLYQRYGRSMTSYYENAERSGDTGVGRASFLSLCLHMGWCPIDEETSILTACDRARTACRSIRNNDRSAMRAYSSELEARNEKERYVISHLDEALNNHYIKVYYQPVVRSMTEEVCGEEALARWDDPSLGLLQPCAFIPVLEQRQLLYRLDLYVLEQVLRDFDIKKEAGLPLVPVSVNLSRNDFYSRDMVLLVSELVDRYHAPHSLIDIEITESAYTSNPEIFMNAVERFHKAGFRVWMDDFGTGYSSLNLLQESKFDLIKLDMKFMKDFGPKNELIITSLLNMAGHLNIDALAEGVETPEQRQFLRNAGCGRMQGFYYGRPQPLNRTLEDFAAGSGLKREHTENSAYLENIGRVDIANPFYLYYESSVSGFNDSIPCAVVEWCGEDSDLTLLRANDGFRKLLGTVLNFHVAPGQFDAIGHSREYTMPVSENVGSMLRKCSENKCWIGVEMEKGMTCYFHFVDRNPQNGLDAFVMAVISAELPMGGGKP